MATIKNQIKSFTSKVTKEQATQFFVFMGGVSTASTVVDETDISLVSRITKDEVATVVPRVNWTQNAQYSPLTIGYLGTDSYVYNSQNGMIYLCVGVNQPTGLVGDRDYPATSLPSHTSGVSTGSDGYTWLALHRIDSTLEKFVSGTVIPVNSLSDFRTDNLAGSFETKYNSLCNGSGAITGSCFFYYNETTYDAATDTTYQAGDQVLGIGTSNWVCSVCHDTGDKLGYKSYHVDTSNRPTQITRNSLTDIQTQYFAGNLDPNSKEYTHFNNYDYVLNLNHGIISLQLDVTDLTVDERIVPSANPAITVLDARGIDATARLRTYYDIKRNAFVANGVELLTAGYDYVNPAFKIAGGSSKLNKAIKAVVVDYANMIDPTTILPTPRISVIKTFSSSDLTNVFSTNQTAFTKVGVVANVILEQDDSNAANGLIPSERADYRATSKLFLSDTSFVPTLPNISVGDVSVSDHTSDTVVITTTDDADVIPEDYTSKIVSLVELTSGPSTAIMEISAVDELTFNILTSKSKVSVDGKEYTIDDVISPEVKVDNIDYVAVRSLETPLNITSPTTVENKISLNFLI